MAPRSLLLAGLAGLAGLASAQQCKLQFDGRIPSAMTLAQFDTANGLFDPSNVFGKGLKLSEILELPCAGGSLFDKNTKPVGVTINDKSIFAPSATNVQTGFRRLELLPASNNGTDASTTGVKTLHFSVMKDPARPLNLTHEYQLVFLESADFATNQFVLKTGSILGQDTPDPDTLQVVGNVNSNPVQTLFATPFTPDVFHNFALTLDFDKNTTQVFYSTGKNPLKAQTQALPNDISGRGQHHFGMLKKGLQSSGDITKTGIQESGINEGLIYGGIFDEDSSDGCISLQ